MSLKASAFRNWSRQGVDHVLVHAEVRLGAAAIQQSSATQMLSVRVSAPPTSTFGTTFRQVGRHAISRRSSNVSRGIAFHIEQRQDRRSLEQAQRRRTLSPAAERILVELRDRLRASVRACRRAGSTRCSQPVHRILAPRLVALPPTVTLPETLDRYGFTKVRYTFFDAAPRSISRGNVPSPSRCWMKYGEGVGSPGSGPLNGLQPAVSSTKAAAATASGPARIIFLIRCLAIGSLAGGTAIPPSARWRRCSASDPATEK